MSFNLLNHFFLRVESTTTAVTIKSDTNTVNVAVVVVAFIIGISNQRTLEPYTFSFCPINSIQPSIIAIEQEA